MNKKLIILIVLAILAIILISVVIIKVKDNKENQMESLITEGENIEEGKFYIRNEVTNEVIVETEDKGMLQKYKDNPDYNPNPTF